MIGDETGLPCSSGGEDGKMPTKTDRRVVVITGGSAGVGRATARAFAERGDAVAVFARGAAGLEGAAKDIEALGGTALVQELDVADSAAVEAAADRVVSELGPIDVWVNSAFSSIFATFTDISAEEFERTTNVTYLGVVNGTRAALRHMRARDVGVIVQVGSALAYRGIPLQSAYCGAKHAIQGFNESLATELLHERSKVRTTMVQLPAVNTPQFDWVLSRLPKKSQPVPPIYQPEVMARAIVHASEHKRREWWVGSAAAATIFGNQIAPGLADRYLGRTGFDSQQTNEPTPPDQPANLWEPADRDTDFGAHGSFDRQARRRSVQWELTKHRRFVWGGLAAAAVATSAQALLRRSR